MGDDDAQAMTPMPDGLSESEEQEYRQLAKRMYELRAQAERRLPATMPRWAKHQLDVAIAIAKDGGWATAQLQDIHAVAQREAMTRLLRDAYLSGNCDPELIFPYWFYQGNVPDPPPSE